MSGSQFRLALSLKLLVRGRITRTDFTPTAKRGMVRSWGASMVSTAGMIPHAGPGSIPGRSSRDGGVPLRSRQECVTVGLHGVSFRSTHRNARGAAVMRRLVFIPGVIARSPFDGDWEGFRLCFGAPLPALPDGPPPVLPNPSRASASKNPGSFVLRTGAVSAGEGWPLTGFL